MLHVKSGYSVVPFSDTLEKVFFLAPPAPPPSPACAFEKGIITNRNDLNLSTEMRG